MNTLFCDTFEGGRLLLENLDEKLFLVSKWF